MNQNQQTGTPIQIPDDVVMKLFENQTGKLQPEYVSAVEGAILKKIWVSGNHSPAPTKVIYDRDSNAFMVKFKFVTMIVTIRGDIPQLYAGQPIGMVVFPDIIASVVSGLQEAANPPLPNEPNGGTRRRNMRKKRTPKRKAKTT